MLHDENRVDFRVDENLRRRLEARTGKGGKKPSEALVARRDLERYYCLIEKSPPRGLSRSDIDTLRQTLRHQDFREDTVLALWAVVERIGRVTNNDRITPQLVARIQALDPAQLFSLVDELEMACLREEVMG